MEQKINRLQTKVFEVMPFLKKNKFSNKLIEILLTAKFFRYLIIGFTTFFIQVGLLFFLIQILGFEKVTANIISSLLSMIFNYTFSNNWTFKAGTGKHKQKIGKYLFLAALNYSFDVFLAFPFLAITLAVNPYIAKVIITGIIVCWNFFIYKFWVFRK